MCDSFINLLFYFYMHERESCCIFPIYVLEREAVYISYLKNKDYNKGSNGTDIFFLLFFEIFEICLLV